MRTFHIGGAASKVVEQTILEAKNSGTIKFININTVTNREGLLVVINRNGSIAVADAKGKKEENTGCIRCKASENGQKVDIGQSLLNGTLIQRRY
jgi:DNA-directed RNA polymerase subunit beta'